MQVCKVKEKTKSPIKLKNFNPAINIITQELSDKITNAVLHFFSKVSKISGVRKIAYRCKGQIITIWTYIDEPKKEILFNIYSIEQQMIENLQDITFDFTVIFSSKEASPTGFREMSVT
jgi:hypothetical protein